MALITLDIPDETSLMDVLTTVGSTYPDVQLVLGDHHDDPDWMSQLSPNQRDIVRLLGNGMPAKQIAEIANVKLGTIRSQIQNVRDRLGIGSLDELVAKAREL